MYQVTKELSINGFSINPLSKIIERNKGNRSLNTTDYFCIYIALTDVEFIIEGKKYEIKRGRLVYVAPSKDITFCTQPKVEDAVYVVAFSSSFYEKATNDSFLLNSDLFFNDNSEVTITQASIPIEEVQKLIINRLALYKTKESEGLYISVAHNCVEALLLDGLFYVDEKVGEKKEMKKFTAFDITNKLRVLLQKYYKKERQVAFYADQLHITPRRLTEMTEATVGKTAKEFIIDKVVSESVRLLRNSTLTISETAYELGFKDEANFSTFMKKYTNKSPRELKSFGLNRVHF